jgi:hypothetical protein
MGYYGRSSRGRRAVNLKNKKFEIKTIVINNKCQILHYVNIDCAQLLIVRPKQSYIYIYIYI